MKKIIFMMLSIVVATIFCTSCSSDSDDFQTSDTGQNVKGDELVTLSFSPYTMESMTRGSGDATGISSITTISRLDVFIINGDDVITVNRDKATDGNTFGSNISVTLNKTKTYTIYAIAHKHSAPVTLENNIVTLPDDATTDCLFYSGTLTPATTTTVNCQMQRVVGMFYFWMIDDLLDGVTKFKFTVSGANTKLNVATGASTNAATWTKTFASLSKADDGYYKFKVFVMSTDAESTIQVDINVQAFDADDNVVKERLFENVNIKNGYRTTYTGPFFTDADMSISFTAVDWYELETVDF